MPAAPVSITRRLERNRKINLQNETVLALPQPQSSSIRRQCKIAFPSCWWSDGIVCFRNVFLMPNNLRTFVLNTSTMRLDFQYMICFRNDEFAYARAVAKKDPGLPPTVPSASAAMQSSEMGSLPSPNSVRACLMTGLACTSYAINILFNQIFKTFSFGVGAQQVCIIIFCHCELQPSGP